MRKSVQDALDWMDHQIDHPSQDWANRCQQSSREAWGLPAWGASAKIAWAKVPESHRHHDLPKDVPAGSLCFGMMNTTYGHAWIAGRGGTGFSVDYRRKHHIDRAPMNLPAWTHDDKVWWTNWTPYGVLPLYADPRNHAKWPDRKDK